MFNKNSSVCSWKRFVLKTDIDDKNYLEQVRVIFFKSGDGDRKKMASAVTATLSDFGGSDREVILPLMLMPADFKSLVFDKTSAAVCFVFLPRRVEVELVVKIAEEWSTAAISDALSDIDGAIVLTGQGDGQRVDNLGSGVFSFEKPVHTVSTSPDHKVEFFHGEEAPFKPEKCNFVVLIPVGSTSW